MGPYYNYFYGRNYLFIVISPSVSHFQPDEQGWSLPEWNLFTELHCKGRLLALPSIIRLGLKWLTVTNTLTYYSTELITAVKDLNVQALGLNVVQVSFSTSLSVMLS